MNKTEEIINNCNKDIYINGKWISSINKFSVINPSSAKKLCEVSNADAQHASLAMDSAEKAQKIWKKRSSRDRSDFLMACYHKILKYSEEFAHIITLEMGKPLAESRGEIKYGAEYFRWFAEEAVRINGRYTDAPMGNGKILVSKEPLGIVYAISPWNFPFAMGARKIAPALAAGCTVILKPAPDTPLSSLFLAKIFHEINFPKGVLNVLPTNKAEEISDFLFEDNRLAKLSFTGSTQVGKLLMAKAAQNIIPCSLELGGNAPFIVFEDAHIDIAVDQAMLAKLRNGGEACTAANRFYIHKSIFETFRDKILEKLKAFKMGDGFDANTNLGPMINQKQRNRMHELVVKATNRGAKCLLGGFIPDKKGYFYPTTLIVDAKKDDELINEEIFGPIICLQSFENEEDVIFDANNTPYGLAAYIFTKDFDRIQRLSSELDYGMIGVNRGVISDPAAPFGGVKQSGMGREGGTEGINDYLRTKYIGM